MAPRKLMVPLLAAMGSLALAATRLARVADAQQPQYSVTCNASTLATFPNPGTSPNLDAVSYHVSAITGTAFLYAAQANASNIAVAVAQRVTEGAFIGDVRVGSCAPGAAAPPAGPALVGGNGGTFTVLFPVNFTTASGGAFLYTASPPVQPAIASLDQTTFTNAENAGGLFFAVH